MKLAQIRQGDRLVAVIVEGKTARVKNAWSVRPISTGWNLVELIQRSETTGAALDEFAQSHANDVIDAELAIPISPLEVWACGCTYQASSSFRDAEHGTREGFYAQVYDAERPELFFKGTARHCVGNYAPIGIRADSKFTAPEPEVALVLGSQGQILGYTLANDVSAWDIERENPLYLPQSKVYTACCALGPLIVTPDEISDPYNLALTCRIERAGKGIFEGSTSTSRLNRRFETLVDFLRRSNPVPAGSVLCTGTGIIVEQNDALAPGDSVTIECPEIGTLTNTAAVV
jgi:2-dehydro-3-deoxy-D-arabinonate dehydratase